MRRSLVLGVALSSAVACGREASSPVAPSPPSPPSVFRASGTVVEIGGGPVAEASVLAARCGAPPPEVTILARTLTDASGRFVLTHDSPSPLFGCLSLWIEKDGYVPQSWEGPRDGVTIRLQRLRRVIGRVMEVDGGPVSRVEVTPYSPHTGARTSTDHSGFFELNHVGSHIVLRKGGYVQRGVTVPEGQDIDLDVVRMQPRIVLSGASSLVSRISSEDVDHDLSWWGSPEYICSPCKEIELQTEQRALEIRLQWTGNIQLDLWVASGSCCEKIVLARARPGESMVTLPVDATANLMYVGVSYPWGAPSPAFADPVAFELTTAVR